jgi:hypothetical protein
VNQSDIGTDPNQIPLNQYLGSLAYQSNQIAVSDVFSIGSDVHVTSAGNLGVGTTGPTAKLDVVGDIKTNGVLVATPGKAIAMAIVFG